MDRSEAEVHILFCGWQTGCANKDKWGK